MSPAKFLMILKLQNAYGKKIKKLAFHINRYRLVLRFKTIPQSQKDGK